MTRGVGGESPSNITMHLKGIEFPCGKQGLLAHVQQSNPDEAVLRALHGLPEREYGSMAEVMEGS